MPDVAVIEERKNCLDEVMMKFAHEFIKGDDHGWRWRSNNDSEPGNVQVYMMQNGIYMFGHFKEGFIFRDSILRFRFRLEENDLHYHVRAPYVKDHRLVLGSDVYGSAVPLAREVRNHFQEPKFCETSGTHFCAKTRVDWTTDEIYDFVKGEENRGHIGFTTQFANPLSKGDNVSIRRSGRNGANGDIYLGLVKTIVQVGGKTGGAPITEVRVYSDSAELFKRKYIDKTKKDLGEVVEDITKD